MLFCKKTKVDLQESCSAPTSTAAGGSGGGRWAVEFVYESCLRARVASLGKGAGKKEARTAAAAEMVTKLARRGSVE